MIELCCAQIGKRHFWRCHRRFLVQRIDKRGGHNHHQFVDGVVIVLRLEQFTQYRNTRNSRSSVEKCGRPVVEQSGDAEALPVAQLHFRLRPPGRDGGDGVAGDRNRVGIVERADFRGYLQKDGAIGIHRRRELQLDAIGAKHDRHRGKVAGSPLDDGIRKFAAGKKVAFMPTNCRDTGLGQDLQNIFRFQVCQSHADIELGVVEQKIQRIGDLQCDLDTAPAAGGAWG